ncbi:MAG TPA: FAD-dependent oxidoreductase [Gammaproteobacteria bacterium]|nr:FAD-dependent oxidoreductase [Gammaproteobacteria bacterium]
MGSDTINEPARRTPVLGEYEIVVLGGGPAGIAAALAAGRCGRSTILIERYGFLGGAGTAAGLSTFCGLHANVHGRHEQVIHGVADDILDRLAAMDGLNKPHLSVQNRIQAQAYDISAYKIAADELLAAAKVTVLFHALGAGALMAAPDVIGALLVETKSGRYAVRGRIFIDASGDGDLAAWAGAPYEVGDGAGNMLYPSTMFRINGVNPEEAGRAWELIPSLMEEAERSGRRFPRKKPIVRPQRNPIEWRANLTQIKNPDGSPVSGIDAGQLSYGEVEGRRQCWDVFQFIKSVTPGFEEAYIVEIAPQIGIRETRRVTGEYVLTDEDILSCRDFDDTIGVNGWPVEAHIKGDVRFVFAPLESRGFNEIPYRIIVPQHIENLFIAGRCASMSHLGQSSARVSGPCFVMGQAAGTAADLALQQAVTPRRLDVPRLQERLLAAGAFLGPMPAGETAAQSAGLREATQ